MTPGQQHRLVIVSEQILGVELHVDRGIHAGHESQRFFGKGVRNARWTSSARGSRVVGAAQFKLKRIGSNMSEMGKRDSGG